MFGETPHLYLQRPRLERAMFLLRTTDDDVLAVCHAVGFTSLGTFARLIAAVVGETPTAYRHTGIPGGRVGARRGRLFHDGPDTTRLVCRVLPTRGPPRPGDFGEAHDPPLWPASWLMNLQHIRLSSIDVLDQDAALDFSVGILGLEVGTDADLGFMRWLTVRVPGDDREILLERPGAPAHDRRPPMRCEHC